MRASLACLASAKECSKSGLISASVGSDTAAEGLPIPRYAWPELSGFLMLYKKLMLGLGDLRLSKLERFLLHA